MRLEGYTFVETFDFTRAVAAPVRNAAGDIVTAAIDVPRFDHEGGDRLGMIVSPGLTLGQADRCAVIAGEWELEGPATVLHEFADTEGLIVRRAYYSDSVRATVNVVLRVEGHHRIIGAVPGLLRNRGGEVRYRQRIWELTKPIGTGVEDERIGDGTDEDRILVEG